MDKTTKEAAYRFGVPPDWDGKTCVVCHREIGTRNKRTVTCSHECTLKRTKKLAEANKPYFKFDLGPGTVGAISELRVAVDLLQRGYPVFRAMSPHCVCDMALICKGKLYRIEVKTAYRTVNGKFAFAPKDKSKYDILAAVAHDAIHYEGLPELNHRGKQ